uniref:Uncharacterized protein n=1 Tax=Cacopsylla melanoneura TaxID=428564 RepID=A0A8D8PW51_9HEMI
MKSIYFRILISRGVAIFVHVLKISHYFLEAYQNIPRKISHQIMVFASSYKVLISTLKPFKVELITRYTCVPHRLPEQSSQGTDPYLIGVNLLITYLYMFLVVFNILIHNH